jgi:hypothetical protein
METRFDNFEDFWVHYVKAHSKKGTRDLHFIGTTAALAVAAAGVLTRKRWLLLAAPTVGYGFAWAGHFLVEGNVPQTFGNPLWSFKADFRMWQMILKGTMDAEVDRIVRQADAEVAPEPARPASTVADPTMN